MYGMDFLIVTGTSASYFYSFVSMVLCALNENYHGHYFFESSAMLLTFVTLGKYMESSAKGQTVGALTQLMKLQPRFANLMEHDGLVREIPVELVQQGDKLRVLPGQSIPTDGIILEGETEVDESMLTGEALLIFKWAPIQLFPKYVL